MTPLTDDHRQSAMQHRVVREDRVDRPHRRQGLASCLGHGVVLPTTFIAVALPAIPASRRPCVAGP
jgi:hypothetical protein